MQLNQFTLIPPSARDHSVCIINISCQLEISTLHSTRHNILLLSHLVVDLELKACMFYSSCIKCCMATINASTVSLTTHIVLLIIICLFLQSIL